MNVCWEVGVGQGRIILVVIWLVRLFEIFSLYQIVFKRETESEKE